MTYAEREQHFADERQRPGQEFVSLPEFQAEREEILKHKWIESEKAGYDIGFEQALTDWIVKHRSKWRRGRQTQVSQN